MIFDRICKLCRHHQHILLYVFFGGCTTVVGMGTFILFDRVLGIHELLANVYSWVLAVGFAYAVNRRWVFRSRVRGKEMGKELLRFYSGRLFTLGLEEGMLLLFVTWLAFPSMPVKLLAQLVVLIGNYLISKLIVFHKKKRA